MGYILAKTIIKLCSYFESELMHIEKKPMEEPYVFLDNQVIIGDFDPGKDIQAFMASITSKYYHNNQSKLSCVDTLFLIDGQWLNNQYIYPGVFEPNIDNSNCLSQNITYI